MQFQRAAYKTLSNKRTKTIYQNILQKPKYYNTFQARGISNSKFIP